MQRVQFVLLFLVQAVKSAQFQILRSYTLLLKSPVLMRSRFSANLQVSVLTGEKQCSFLRFSFCLEGPTAPSHSGTARWLQHGDPWSNAGGEQHVTRVNQQVALFTELPVLLFFHLRS